MRRPALDDQIRAWRSALEATGDVGSDDATELEAHLRDEIRDLRGRGLSESEALIVAARRIGETNHLSREYFKVNVNRLWKRLAVPAGTASANQTWITFGLPLAAALLAQIPYMFGGTYFGDGRERWSTFASLWILPSMIAWFRYRHSLSLRRAGAALIPLLAIHLFAALFGFDPGSSSRVLVMLHIPFLSWLLLMPLALDDAWRTISGAIHYLRLSAEAFLYAVLIGLAGLTLLVLTITMFETAGVNIEEFAIRHLVVAGIYGAPVVGLVLADRKRQVIENFAPTLARIFAPLFVVAIGAFLAAILVTNARPGGDRELLLVVNAVLLLVVGMLFYDASAREEDDVRRLSDWANVALLAGAIALDTLALTAISSRLFAFGASPNRAALFGLNAVLLVHLGTLTVTYARYLTGSNPFRAIERAIVRAIPVYGFWLVVVVVVFPIAFRGA